MIRVETDGFGDLARDLRKASASVGKELVPVVKKGAGNVKRGMRSDMSKSRHFGQVAGTIDYEVDRTPVSVEAEIGPNKTRYPGLPGPPRAKRAAPIANIAYFGGVNGGGGKVRDPEYHAHEEAPRFEKAVADVVDGLL